MQLPHGHVACGSCTSLISLAPATPAKVRERERKEQPLIRLIASKCESDCSQVAKNLHQAAAGAGAEAGAAAGAARIPFNR